MKKNWCLLILLILFAAPHLAADLNRRVFIEGSSARRDQQSFFMENFIREGTAAGYTIANKITDAGYTFHFEVTPHMIEYDDGTVEQAPPEEKQYIITITFIRNDDMTELVSFGFPFNELTEMYDYTQFLFLRAAVNIPLPGDNVIIVQEPSSVPHRVQPKQDQDNDDWQNKWLYLRLSFDFPITFYTLQGDGLHKDVGVYGYDKDNKLRVSPLDNRVSALPGITLGVEVQFLNWMSVEPNFQVTWEYLNDKDFINLAMGFELKFPLKFVKNLVLEPYGAISFPLAASDTVSKIFASYPAIAFGGGFHGSIKRGETDAVFIDINYMYFGDVGIYNHFDKLYPMPEVIQFQRSVIGIGIGYKFGLLDRKPPKQ
ncbi:MAG: hypothetical protein LBH44_02775 [Treponema sp.]|jgi:hypothetical protein|nr:hypothetical protein [Treponema sp.]